MLYRHIKLENVDTRSANSLKKEFSTIGGVAAISSEAYAFTERSTDVILSGSVNMFKLLIARIDKEEFGLAAIARDINECLSDSLGVMQFSKRVLDFRYHTYLMAQLNSKSTDKSCHKNISAMLNKVESFAANGVSILDISCKQYDELYSEKEIIEHFNSFTYPLIESIKKEFPGLLLSIDTDRYIIARKALDIGVDMISELSPLHFNEQLINLIAKEKCPVILLHSNGTRSKDLSSVNSISRLIRDIQSTVSFAVGHGISREKIIVDPGFGFSRHFKTNIVLLKNLTSIKHLNLPLVIGMTKRSFFSETLDWKQVQMHISTISANIMAITNGANIIRVNSVRQAQIMVEVLHSLGLENDEMQAVK